MAEIKEKGYECTAKCLEKDDYPSSTPGVLLSNEIKHYAVKHEMIHPFDEEFLKPAGYRLRLGEEYAIGGELKRLYPEPGKDELKIPPFEVAIITTKETVNLPRFIIARWNLRVSLVYDGLLWTGALQVDPGWCGSLSCPIYNLSNEEVTLRLGEPIVLMDFVKTTPFIKGDSAEYRRPPQRQTLKDYHYRLKSALFTEAGQKIKKVEEKISRVESLIGLLFTSIAILFTSLAILVTSRNVPKDVFSPPVWFILWIFLCLSLSIIAITFSLKGESGIISRWLEKKWFIVIAAIIAVFLAGSVFIQVKDITERRRDIEQLNSLKKQVLDYINNKGVEPPVAEKPALPKTKTKTK